MVRLFTKILIGVALDPAIPAPVGIALADKTAAPRLDGFQLQEMVIFGEDPDVNLFVHPGIRIPFTLKVTFAATVKFAFICTTVRYVALPAIANELKPDVSTTSVTVTVTVSYPAFSELSTARKTTR